MKRILTVHASDNVTVALEDLRAGEAMEIGEKTVVLLGDVPQKHKFNTVDIAEGEEVLMYGVTIGRATKDIPSGSLIDKSNVTHKAGAYTISPGTAHWQPPSTDRFTDLEWYGYYRRDGRVGTRNYWLVIPMVFCENRNVEVLRESLAGKLGYLSERDFSVDVDVLVQKYRDGATAADLIATDVLRTRSDPGRRRIFDHVDGIKFLTHEGGCGGTRDDVQNLCNLLAGYITHPNVGGATVLSLGCQMAQVELLKEALHARDPGFSKPLEIFDQQQSSSERTMIAEAVKKTFVGLAQINEERREKAGWDAICLGLECGGSDGFSGISANPALGHASDLLVALGGRAILSEFPELHGAEQDLINRCADLESARKFAHLMETYAHRAEESGSGFDMNPSPGNIRDGLITDAMKSAGAAKKGGTSPITSVLDYTEPATKSGLHLLCTPGNDVESTTGLAGSGANIIAFTTGLGTPTGNPVAPTIKISSNSELAGRMSGIIDLDAGTIITGAQSVEEKGEELLHLILRVASGELETKSERLGQDDFIPWKRGVSL